MHRHGYKGRKFGRETDQRLALRRALMCALIENQTITTTLARAKEIRRSTEKLITIAKKVGANNALFGAVTKDEIAHAINEHLKVSIDKKWIVIAEPIKHTGDFKVEIKLGSGLSAQILLHIIEQ